MNDTKLQRKRERRHTRRAKIRDGMSRNGCRAESRLISAGKRAHPHVGVHLDDVSLWSLVKQASKDVWNWFCRRD